MTYEEALYLYTHNGATIEQERECESLVKEALEKQNYCYACGIKRR